MAVSLLLSGCPLHDDDDEEPIVRTEPIFRVTISNLTNNQPLSPVTLIAHDNTTSYWTIGDSASTNLEQLAEGGDNAALADDVIGSGDKVYLGTGPIPPGGTETISVEVDPTIDDLLSIVSMLVNTNDGLAALSELDLAAINVGATVTGYLSAYDAGTEKNTEANGTTPGTGGGFDATRDDIADQVTRHPGVVTTADGLSTSVLNSGHRFDSPVALVSVERTQ